MSQGLEDLYKDIILKHNDAPVNYHKREEAQHQLEAYNQFCGDHFHLYFDIAEGIVKDISFHGYGCAISKASTSVLVEMIKGKSVEEVKSLHAMMQKIIHASEEDLHLAPEYEDLLAFAAARKFPGRKKCATLSWDELGEYLINPQ